MKAASWIIVDEGGKALRETFSLKNAFLVMKHYPHLRVIPVLLYLYKLNGLIRKGEHPND